jgi:uncharacterized OB-fold protein
VSDDLVMHDFVSLTYTEVLTPNLQRFAQHLLAGHFVGHRSPSGRVYVPGKGYDPLTLEVTTQDDEIEVADTGTVAGYTIVTPVRYYGQEETEPFVSAQILLDGASNVLHGQHLLNIAHEEVRTCLRVRAVWKPEEERTVDGMNNRGWGGLEGVVDGFEPTGEPDAPPEMVREHQF